jgi:alanine racemase
MTYEDATGRCWLEVDLDAILENHRAARALMGPDAAVVPVLKADAYGMGAAVVGRLLADDGARLFAVATGDEAEQLMRALPGDAKVLTMGLVGRAQMVRLIRAGMPLTLFSERQGMSIAEAARAAGEAAWVHVKVDTGLHRLGLAPETAADAVAELMQTGVIRVAGLYTHLAIHTAETDRAQTAKLREVRAAFLARDIDVPMTHAVDSIGMARYPEDHMDAARAGAWLYGVAPAGFDRPALCRRGALQGARRRCAT